jgi:hypothetical protein
MQLIYKSPWRWHNADAIGGRHGGIRFGFGHRVDHRNWDTEILSAKTHSNDCERAARRSRDGVTVLMSPQTIGEGQHMICRYSMVTASL